MEKLKKLFQLIAVTGLLFSCSKDDDSFNVDSFDHQYGYDKVNTQVQGLDQDRFVTMQSIDLKVHYRIIGKGPVDIVFISGLSNPLTVYTKQFDYFRDKARCIYIDLPGHGLSDAPEGIDYTMGLMGDAIFDVVKKEGIKNFIGIGFSWGWKPLQFMEMKHPGMITQLVLLDVAVPAWPPLGKMSQTTYNANIAMYRNLTPEARRVFAATGPEDYLEWGLYYQYIPNWLLVSFYTHYAAEEACQPYPWTIPIMGIWRITTLLPGSQLEQNVLKFFPGVEINIIGNLYNNHAIPWAQAETVNQMIVDFMADRPGRRY